MNEDRLNRLLAQWQAQKNLGRDVQAIDLCPDCPELADELNRRIGTTPRMAQPAQECNAPSESIAPTSAHTTGGCTADGIGA